MAYVTSSLTYPVCNNQNNAKIKRFPIYFIEKIKTIYCAC
jgi:hypothetical protein